LTKKLGNENKEMQKKSFTIGNCKNQVKDVLKENGLHPIEGLFDTIS